MAQATTTSNVKTNTANRVVIQFGGVSVGLLQSARLADSYALEDASGIGDIHVVEHVPTKAVHTIAVSNMTLFTGHMRDQGISRINGDDALRGLVFDIVVLSKDTGLPVRAAKSCSFDSGTTSIEAHRIVMQEGQFKALDVAGFGI